MKKYLFFTVVSILLFSSCFSTKYISIDVYQPARVTLSPEIVNIAIVDNTPLYLNNEIIAANGREDIEQIPLDTAKVVFVDSLCAYLNRENFFGDVLAYPYLTGIDDDKDRSLSLTSSKIKGIAEEMEVDAVITLDNFFISGKLFKISDPYVGGFTQEMSLGILIKMSLYSSEGEVLSKPVVLSDTLYWNDYIEFTSGRTNYKPLPSFNEATQEMAIMSAESLVRQFTPYWESQARFYFSDSKTDKLVESYKWDEALAIWSAEYNKEKKDAKKVRLAYNIALAHECLGDIDEALKWINISSELLPSVSVSEVRKQVSLYSVTLQNRAIALEKLANQIGSVNNTSEADIEE